MDPLSSQDICGDGQTFSSKQEQQQHVTKHKLAAVQALVQLVLQNYGQVNVDVREAGPGAGLGLFASKAIRKGGVILSFPTDLGFVGKARQNGVLDFLLDYAADLKDPGSPRALMWASSPCPHELRHLLTFPQQYLPLLQHEQLESWLGRGLHHDLTLFSRFHARQLQAAGVSHDDLVHALGLIGTRTFAAPDTPSSSSAAGAQQEPTTSYYALPLIDMANHRNSCPHFNHLQPCRFDPSRQCAFFTAGADVAAGEEVCLFYGFLLPDRALLEYGFLPQELQLQAAAGGVSPASSQLLPGTGTGFQLQRVKQPVQGGHSVDTAVNQDDDVQREEAVLDAAEAVVMAADAMLMAEEASGVPAEAMLPTAVEADAAAPLAPAPAAAAGGSSPAGPQQGPEAGPSDAAERLQLFGIDRHDFDRQGSILFKMSEQPPEFQGASSSEVRRRVQELQQLLARLRSGDAAAEAVAAMGPAAGDEDGSFLQQVLLWRRLRQQAVAAEIARLQDMLPAHS